MTHTGLTFGNNIPSLIAFKPVQKLSEFPFLFKGVCWFFFFLVFQLYNIEFATSFRKMKFGKTRVEVCRQVYELMRCETTTTVPGGCSNRIIIVTVTSSRIKL